MILGFFFSRNMSVEKWDSFGLLDREKLIYEKHLNDNHLSEIFWFTYGSADLKYSAALHPKIKIVAMPKLFDSRIGMTIYSFLIPIIQKKHIKKCHILKNDQMDGSWSAVISKLLYKKKLIIRTGFTLSLFMKQQGTPIKEFIAFCMEKFAYSFCDKATVSSQESKNYILKKYNLSDERVNVLYNYIDTSVFKPDEHKKEANKLLFVGRLEEQKNLKNLFLALKDIGVELDIYGEGSLKDELILLAKSLNIKVNFLGKVANSKMPQILNSYKYYILPSLYEGMPKTLLEAMSCEVVCIGTDTLGINEVIKDNKNGYLIEGFSAVDIAKRLKEVFLIKDYKEIRKNARDAIEQKFSLNSYSSNENMIFKKLINEY